MSIRDYNQSYVIINGITNEQIVIPKAPYNTTVMKDMYINDFMLFQQVLQELRDCDTVTICKTYMKDN